MVLPEHVICRGHFWEKGGYTLNDTMRGESHMGVRQFWRGEKPRGHHGIASLDKCNNKFLMPLFWLQFSSIRL